MNEQQPPGDIGSEQSQASTLMAELKAQCERLQQVVLGLEEEKRRDAEALADMRAQLIEYHRFLYDWARHQVRPEDWQDFAEDDYIIRPEDALKELERQ